MEGIIQRPDTEPLYCDISIRGRDVFDLELPPEYHAFIYVVDGNLSIGDDIAPARHMGILTQDSDQHKVSVRATAESTRFLFIAGRPLNEPIVQYGPFVMTTQEEIEQTLHDYRTGKF